MNEGLALRHLGTSCSTRHFVILARINRRQGSELGQWYWWTGRNNYEMFPIYLHLACSAISASFILGRSDAAVSLDICDAHDGNEIGFYVI